MTILHRLYPEAACGGFSRVDGSVEFYGRINALLRPDMAALNFGAGRGVGVLEDAVTYRRNLRSLRGKVRKVTGVDIDSVVTSNPDLDEACVILPGEKLPFPDEHFDLIVSDSVFEHVDNPQHVSRELARVIKVGGWICARTPNKWGYAGIATNLIPNKWHTLLLRTLQPERQAKDVFPTRYAMNSWFALRRLFPDSVFRNHTYTMNGEPAYFGNSMLAWRFMMLVFRFTPEAFGSTFFIFIQKR